MGWYLEKSAWNGKKYQHQSRSEKCYHPRLCLSEEKQALQCMGQKGCKTDSHSLVDHRKQKNQRVWAKIIVNQKIKEQRKLLLGSSQCKKSGENPPLRSQ